MIFGHQSDVFPPSMYIQHNNKQSLPVSPIILMALWPQNYEKTGKYTLQTQRPRWFGYAMQWTAMNTRAKWRCKPAHTRLFGTTKKKINIYQVYIRWLRAFLSSTVPKYTLLNGGINITIMKKLKYTPLQLWDRRFRRKIYSSICKLCAILRSRVRFSHILHHGWL